jgi:hypothetical protein
MGGFNNSEDKQQEQDDKIKNITIGIFFDGTSNNRYNVKAKKVQMVLDNEKGIDNNEKNEILLNYSGHDYTLYKIQKQYTDHNTSSYENDNSNVDRLQPYYVKSGDIYSLYIEGEGTSSEEDKNVSGKINYGDDDQGGYAFGRGKTGIRAKVCKACEKVADICAKKGTNITINQITFDVYGFSRGAAAARNFVDEVTRYDGLNELMDSEVIDDLTYGKEGDDVTKLVAVLIGNMITYERKPTGKKVIRHGFLGYFLNEKHIKNIASINIEIRFVGIFDTVASYAKYKDIRLPAPNWKNRIGQLNLNSVSHHAKKIVHFTAADEHRINFALTRIPSGKNPEHIELTLPGAHSDIGGSYMNDSNEKQILDKGEVHNIGMYATFSTDNLKKRIQQLLDESWFNDRDDSLNIVGTELIGIRKGLCNKYSFISLQMMHRFSNEEISGLFQETVKKKYSIPEPNPGCIKEFKRYLNTNFESLLQFFEEDYIEGNNSKPFSYTKYKKHFDTRKGELHARVEIDLKLYRSGLLMSLGLVPETGAFLALIKERLESYAFHGKPPLTFKTAQQILNELGLNDDTEYKAENIRKKMPELKDEIVMQNYLHLLRNKYLHLSSRYDGTWSPFQPTASWIRDVI